MRQLQRGAVGRGSDAHPFVLTGIGSTAAQFSRNNPVSFTEGRRHWAFCDDIGGRGKVRSSCRPPKLSPSGKSIPTPGRPRKRQRLTL